ncbi:MAG TPA: hypothetical protein DDW95_07065 [Alphaproteobacteria bacterium]|nr:hypothetical protein [Alphaproteobacteria bacterium]HBF98293.1 hypothetical protein [Alphaproteobacteria bacterium]
MTQFYYEVHEGNGPFLFLLHGMLSSRAQWLRNLDTLKQFSTPVIAEFWGHGRSPSPEDPAYYDPMQYVAQIENIRKAVGAERWFLCGQSFGATATLRYSLHYPERVMGQIFTNSTSALATNEVTKELYRDVNKLAQKLESGGPEGLKKMRIHPIHAKRLPPGAQEELLEDAPLLNPSGIARVFKYTSPHASVADEVSATTVPTLLVAGEQEDRFTPHREYGEKHIRGLEVVGADGGHAINIEAPEAFNQAVRDFIARNS